MMDDSAMLDTLQGNLRTNLDCLMRNSGMTQRELAARMGANAAFVNRVLHVKANVTIKTLCRIAAAFGYRVVIGFVKVEEP